MRSPHPIPPVEIEVDGQEIPRPLIRDLVEVRVQQRLSQPTLCELVFFEEAGNTLERMVKVGSSLNITLTGISGVLFSGQITAVEYVYDASGGRELRIRGYDALYVLRQRQQVRAHVQVTLSSLARELVSDLGVTVQADIEGPVWERLIQTRSDLELLVDLAERCGLFLSLRGTTLCLITLAGAGPSHPLRLGETLLEARAEINANMATRSVSVDGWNPWRGQQLGGRARTPRVGRKVPGEARPSMIGGSDERAFVGACIQNVGQAEALAQAELDNRAAQEVIFWGVATGNPQLVPGALVTVEGMAEAISGKYALTSVNHIIDAQHGFISEVSTAPPFSRPREKGANVTLAQVINVDDPEHLGRIQVSLHAYGSVESDWLEVMAPGAGRSKGLFALPSVDDTVLLLFANDDPAQAVVIGSLFTTHKAPKGEERTGKGASFSFLSPGGQRIRLDDGKQTLRLENSLGSFLELAPDHVRLHAATRLEIDAPGQNVLIQGKLIDFKRAE